MCTKQQQQPLQSVNLPIGSLQCRVEILSDSSSPLHCMSSVFSDHLPEHTTNKFIKKHGKGNGLLKVNEASVQVQKH